jgi:dipeptidyl aminopeptidase/acylaminoacyl peptidase
MPVRKKRLITADDLYNFQLLSDPRISPDGRHMAYIARRVERKTEKKYANLWIVPTESGEPRQFTYGDQTDGPPRWSPDGKTIAFLSNRGDQEKSAQIYLIPFDGGEARKLTDLDGEIGEFSWSPDGKRLLLQFRKTDVDVAARRDDENLKKLGVPARHYDRLFYKLDGYGYLPHERWHLWTVDARTGKAKQLTDHDVYDETSASWSVDGKWITFVSNRSADPDQDVEAVDLFVMPAAGGEMRLVPTPAGEKSQPAFSLDGKWIAYYGQPGGREWYRNTGLWVVPADGSAPAVNLTAKHDFHCSNWTINDMGQPEEIRPVWSPDGQTIYFPVVKHGSSLLMSIPAVGGKPQVVIDGQGVVGSYSFDRAFTRIGYLYGRMDDPGQLHVRDLASGGDRVLTRQNDELLAALDLGEMETVWYKGPDGNDLQGWVLKPPGFDPKKKYPSILEIHGGPLTQYGYFFMHEFYFLAAQGYVVYFTNPRGGRGYGEKHAGGIFRNWGTNDYADLMAWADRVEKLPYIDKNRMGVTGGSYGGYMTLWIIGHTQRFKAAVAQRVVSNFVSMWGSSDFNWTFEQELSNKPPFEDLQYFWDRSPMKYIGNARTPTLISHSENDHRCPIEQGEQAFVALKRLGVDTEFVRYPDEFHGVSRTGRTDRRIIRLTHFARWFDRYLKP